MKRILLFLLLFVLAFGRAQQLQSVTYQNWETAHWQDWMKQEFTYDTNGGVAIYAYQVWDETTLSWKNSSQTLVTNDTSGRPLQYVNQSWDAETNSWTNGSRSTYTYSAFGNAQDLVLDLWEDDHWNPFSRTDYYYDTLQFLNIESQQTWDADTADWVLSSSILYANDNNGNVLEYATGQWVGDALVLTHRVTQTFSATNKILTAITDTRTNGGQWLNYSKSAYAYDANDYLIFGLFQNWQAESGSWIDNYHHNYTNNPNGTIAEFTSQQWNNPAWVNFQRAIYDYGILGVSENEKASFTVYPNPTADFVQVNVRENGSAQVSVIGSNGKILKQQTLSEKHAMIDLQGLSCGIYLLLFHQNGTIQTQKIIKN